jgi:hypothetical protein
MKKLLLLFLPLMLLASCVSEKDIDIKGVSDVKYDLLLNGANVDFSFAIANRSAHKVKIQDGMMTVSYDGAEVLNVYMRDKVVIPRRSDGQVSLPLRVRLADNSLAALSLFLSDVDVSKFTLSGSAVVKAGWGRKKTVFQDVALSEILSNFGLEDKKLPDILKQKL